MNKRIILVIIILIIIAGIIYQLFLKKEEPKFTLEKVKRATIKETISETGAIKKGEEVSLSFEEKGKISEVRVKVGDKVEENQVLAKLDTSNLLIELEEAKASLEVAQAKFNKLMKGSTKEEIEVAQAKVSKAQTDLENANQNLKDVKAAAQDNIDQDYGDALSTLDDASLKITNSLNDVDSIQRNYFTSNDQEGTKVREEEDRIRDSKNNADYYLDLAKQDSTHDNIDTALSKFKESLTVIYNSLSKIREICEQPSYRNDVSSSDKTTLDNHKSYINTAKTNIEDSQQDISSTEISNQSKINTAQSKVSKAEASLEEAEKNLSLVKAEPTDEEIKLHKAQVKQAKANINLLEKKIRDSIIRSPVEGQIAKVEKRVGETVKGLEPVLILIPEVKFQVEVDIYEEDIAKVERGDPVEIKVVAFPGQELKGEVVAIDPSEKIIKDVVYYEVTISLAKEKKGIKPGMTADIEIITASKENTLVIPEEALQRKKGRNIVEVYKEGRIEEREVKIGLKSDNKIEIVSGLKQGQQVILR